MIVTWSHQDVKFLRLRGLMSSDQTWSRIRSISWLSKSPSDSSQGPRSDVQQRKMRTKSEYDCSPEPWRSDICLLLLRLLRLQQTSDYWLKRNKKEKKKTKVEKKEEGGPSVVQQLRIHTRLIELKRAPTGCWGGCRRCTSWSALASLWGLSGTFVELRGLAKGMVGL